MNMSFLNMSPLEAVFLVLFSIYIVAPVPIPAYMIPVVNNNVALAVLIIFALFMLLNTNPILGVVSVFAVYCLIERVSKSFNILNKPTQTIPANPEKKKANKMKKMNTVTKPAQANSLEEELINKMAPIGKSPAKSPVQSTFKPVSHVRASKY
jgi:hypothetical protein